MTTQIKEKEVTMYYYYENPDYEANPISWSFIKVLSITENIFTALVIGVLSITTRACIPLYMDKAAREQGIHLPEGKAREARVLYIGPDVDPKLKTFILPFSPVGGANCESLPACKGWRKLLEPATAKYIDFMSELFFEIYDNKALFPNMDALKWKEFQELCEEYPDIVRFCKSQEEMEKDISTMYHLMDTEGWLVPEIHTVSDICYELGLDPNDF